MDGRMDWALLKEIEELSAEGVLERLREMGKDPRPLIARVQEACAEFERVRSQPGAEYALERGQLGTTALAARSLGGRAMVLLGCAVCGAVAAFGGMWMAMSDYELGEQAQMVVAFVFLAGCTVFIASMLGLVALVGHVYVAQRLEIVRLRQECATAKKRLEDFVRSVERVLRARPRSIGPSERTELETALAQARVA